MFVRRFRNFHLRDLIECATFVSYEGAFSYKSATIFLRMPEILDHILQCFESL